MRIWFIKWMGIGLAVFTVPQVFAADGVWTNTAGGNWNDVSNWQDGGVAGGLEYGASFASQAPTGSVVVLPEGGLIGTVEGGAQFTLGKTGSGVFSLKNASSFLGLWQLSGGTLELLAEETQPAFLINVEMSNQTAVSIPTAGTSAVISNLTGSAELIKSGNGILSVKRTDSASVITISQGTLAVSSWVPSSVPAEGAWFHVDATVSSSVVIRNPLNGTNFVETWGDARYASNPALYTEYSNNGIAATRPFIRANVLNGRAVMDFGSLYHPTLAPGGYGGNLPWHHASATIRECFLVFSDSPDSPGYYSNLLGGDGFIRGVSGQLIQPTTTAQNIALQTGDWTVDGESVNPTTYCLTPGFHVVSFAVTQAVTASAFAKWTYGRGGQQLAEVLIYTNALTAAKRRQNTDYLSYKWFARLPPVASVLTLNNGCAVAVADGDSTTVNTLVINGNTVKTGGGTLTAGTISGDMLTISNGLVRQTSDTGHLQLMSFGSNATLTVEGAAASLSLDRIEANGSVTKTGNGAVTVGTLGEGVSNIVVEGGRFTVSGSGDSYFRNYREPWFHVDATVSSSVVIRNPLNGTNFVETWGDARYASNPALYTEYSNNGIAATRPFIRANVLNGRAVMDFGSLYHPTLAPGGYGGNLPWHHASATIRECFLVFSDSPDSPGYYSNLLGGDGFIRGVSGQLIQPTTTAQNIALQTGDWTVDGESVNPTTYCLTPGFHVVSFAVTQAVTASAFAKWTDGRGGQQLAEVIIHTNGLTVAERQNINGYLRSKWLGLLQPLASVRVAAGSEMLLSANALAVATLAGAGTVTVPSITASTLSAGDVEGSTRTLSLSGDLDVADGATVTVDIVLPSCDCVDVGGTLRILGGGTFVVNCDAHGLAGIKSPPVFTFAAIEGTANLAAWKVTGSVCSRYTVKPVVEENSLRFAFASKGLVLTLQ
ncbi:MAG: hypothetical protein RBT78_13490 [Kiritimatiellia bacterium]|nr:hypothetical protein [Kiritimatiellia bacterium]